MHVLFVGFVWPEPTSSAAGQNILSYVNACLAQQWRVTFCSAAEPTGQSVDLAKLGVTTFQAELNHSSFDKRVSELRPDIVIFDRFLSYEQFAWRVKQACPNAMLVLDAEDLHGLRHARHQYLKHTSINNELPAAETICETTHQHYLYNDISLRELACIYMADVTLVLSHFEQQLLRNTFNVPKHQIAHMPFIINPAEPSVLSYTQKQDFVFIGNFRHAPNYHAAKVLREQIWPKLYQILKSEHPNIACHVYGAYLSPKAKQLENKSLRFFVHGYAHDQFDVINQARVMLAPIAFGAGVKGKFLDAMQCHTPSVTSTIGSEGITHLPWAGKVCDNIADIITHSAHLYNNEADWQQANTNGKNILQHDYAYDSNQQAFIECLSKHHAALTTHRQNSFLQQLLSKQQFQSSKYMSQWIEAKNKHQQT